MGQGYLRLKLLSIKLNIFTRMEILLILLVVGTVGSIAIWRNKLPHKPKMILSALAGTTLIAWFWLMPEGLVYWTVIITVVVLSSLFKLAKTWKNESIKTKERP